MLFISFIIPSTSFLSLLTRLSVDNAQSVRYFIQFLSANSVILTKLSAQALCHAMLGNSLDLAHLLFQSIIIQIWFGQNVLFLFDIIFF